MENQKSNLFALKFKTQINPNNLGTQSGFNFDHLGLKVVMPIKP